VLGKELLPSLIAADLCHPSVSINVMDRIVSDLEDRGQGAVAGALTIRAPARARTALLTETDALAAYHEWIGHGEYRISSDLLSHNFPKATPL
ncbi:MAG: hypothetical protein ACYCXX_15155, partial [Acidiferrobacter thiooxydans]